MAAVAEPLSASDRWRIAARRAGTHSLIVWPPVALAVLTYASVRKSSLEIDLARAYIPAAHRVIHGHSPYTALTLKGLARGSEFVYPPAAAWLVAPLAALPLGVAEAIGLVLMLACVVGTLLLLGVRDWRCHMIALLWVPTYAAIQTGNLALPLAVGIAAVWRYRDRRLVAGLLAGVLVALKLYLWPVALWLVMTRRVRAGIVAAATAAAVLTVSWAAIGFAGLRGYPHLVTTLTRIERGNAYTVAALVAPLSSWRIATVVATLCGLAVLAFAWRRAHLADERGALVAALAGMLLLTPIVWMDYFVVLLIVIALYARRLNWLWALPIGLWVGPQVSNGRPWQTAAVLCLACLTFAAAPAARHRLG
jgi:hypothetical protein